MKGFEGFLDILLEISTAVIAISNGKITPKIMNG
jgi:hypothetical protein